jgi:hypothetical protein
MKVSTLRDLIAAMGGELQISAAFADHSVEIGGFGRGGLRDGGVVSDPGRP